MALCSVSRTYGGKGRLVPKNRGGAMSAMAIARQGYDGGMRTVGMAAAVGLAMGIVGGVVG